jgi:hypothetical protein
MSDSQHPPGVSRRRLFAAAGTAGALAAAATTLPRKPHAEPPPDPAPDAGKGTGYRLTEHIQRYYQTTKV